MIRKFTHHRTQLKSYTLKVHYVVFGEKDLHWLIFLCLNKLKKHTLSLFSWRNKLIKQTDFVRQFHPVLLCLYVAVSANFLPSASDWGGLICLWERLVYSVMELLSNHLINIVNAEILSLNFFSKLHNAPLIAWLSRRWFDEPVRILHCSLCDPQEHQWQQQVSAVQ